MNLVNKKIILCFIIMAMTLTSVAQTSLPSLHVDGRYLKDNHDNIVNLHGFAQTYSPWFNERGTKWSNYDVKACLNYNQGLIDQILQRGWKVNWIRIHMDPYWSNTPGKQVTGENDISAFSMDRFKKYLAEVFIPMAKYANEHGLYVVMRPPGVCPKTISVGGDYQKYLLKVWSYVSQQEYLRNNTAVMFELANEPIQITNLDGSAAGDKEMTQFFQAVVDTIRNHCDNICLVPGLGYQSSYAGFANYPILGDNIGYAVHCYPGWYNGAHDQSEEIIIDYEKFHAGWAAQVGAVARTNPIIVTEMDWAPVKDGNSWGKSTTGTPGGTGFGANFKKIADEEGNVSWMIFTSADLLAKYDGKTPAETGDTTILNDPEACVWPAYHWFQEYAKVDYPIADDATMSEADLTTHSLQLCKTRLTITPGTEQPLSICAVSRSGLRQDVTRQCVITSDDPTVATVSDGVVKAVSTDGVTTLQVSYTDGAGNTLTKQLPVNVTYFPLTSGSFNPSIYATGTFDEATKIFTTGQWGFAGWQYAPAIDLSAYNYLIVEMGCGTKGNLSFRIFDKSSYWSDPYAYNFPNGSTRAVINLHMMRNIKDTGDIDPSHIYIAGFWSNGGQPNTISRIFVSNDGKTPATKIKSLNVNTTTCQNVYNIIGQMVRQSNNLDGLKPGIYIIGGKKRVFRGLE